MRDRVFYRAIVDASTLSITRLSCSDWLLEFRRSISPIFRYPSPQSLFTCPYPSSVTIGQRDLLDSDLIRVLAIELRFDFNK
jgi:hypothetical protein